MGILNVTPDSFFDGGKYLKEELLVTHINKLIHEGADIIDIGGCSTKAGAATITTEEELERVIPAIQLTKALFPKAIISVDTYNHSVAVRAVSAGADMVNDISGGTLDDNMFDTVRELNVPYILMHIQNTPATMQLKPAYTDVVMDVYDHLQKQIDKLSLHGFNKIIVDPGFGFGKTVDHNYEILKNLHVYKMLGYPLLTGVSRKSMINSVLGTLPKNALNGTSVLNTICLLNGADILRVHDVKEAKEVVTLIKKYRS
ncbi:MAG: dihydropteroate synthase [Bacteroidetes bacterium]|nr:dihydropteroate synthase [Bacteroidota bacterium]